ERDREHDERRRADAHNHNRTSILLYPSLTWQKRHIDLTTYADNGYFININLLASQKALLTDTSFIQGRVDIKVAKNLTYAQRLVVHGSIGASLVNDVLSLPTSLRFRTGGAHSVRAYPFESLGPGKFLTVAGIELQQRLN